MRIGKKFFTNVEIFFCYLVRYTEFYAKTRKKYKTSVTPLQQNV